MKKFLSILLVSAMIASLAAGCAKDTDSQSSTLSSTQTEATTTQASSSSSESSASTAYPYTYTDAAGRDLSVESEPVKIATNYLPLWETLLLLGITPVAASGSENYLATWDAFEGYDMGEVADLGSGEVNMELLLEIQPDLFLYQVADPTNVDVSNFEQISNVAVFGNNTKMDWRLSLREVAKLVGKEEKAEEVIADFDKNIADAREQLAAKYQGQTVLQMSLMDADKYYCANRAFLYNAETGLGLKAPEGYTTSETYEQVSIEALVGMNPDYIFVNVFDGDEALFENLQNNSVWKSLKAVQDGHVYRLDGGGHAPSGLATQYTVNKVLEALLA